MWGQEQIDWFMETVAASDATFKILIAPTPLTGPYIDPIEMDNHTNEAGFLTEGRRLLEFIASQENMYVIAGDRHYQYVIEDPESGVREYATGPASNEHARGWDNDDVRPEQRHPANADAALRRQRRAPVRGRARRDRLLGGTGYPQFNISDSGAAVWRHIPRFQ
jgi:hypothetical protein